MYAAGSTSPDPESDVLPPAKVALHEVAVPIGIGDFEDERSRAVRPRVVGDDGRRYEDRRKESFELGFHEEFRSAEVGAGMGLPDIYGNTVAETRETYAGFLEVPRR